MLLAAARCVLLWLLFDSRVSLVVVSFWASDCESCPVLAGGRWLVSTSGASSNCIIAIFMSLFHCVADWASSSACCNCSISSSYSACKLSLLLRNRASLSLQLFTSVLKFWINICASASTWDVPTFCCFPCVFCKLTCRDACTQAQINMPTSSNKQRQAKAQIIFNCTYAFILCLLERHPHAVHRCAQVCDSDLLLPILAL